MRRRSIYMNSADQARKEARKRELKKNKKQRQMIRAAVLKGKVPLQLINDMEKIDEIEYNVNSPPLLNENVLKDKRKKLRETWDRVMRLYFKEDRKGYNELKKLEFEYKERRSVLMRFYESFRIAQQVQIDEIPLPDTPAFCMPLPKLIRPPTAPPRLPGASSAPTVAPPGTTSAQSTPATSEANITVLSGPPRLMQRPKTMTADDETQRSVTIEAKPQIRNLSADITRFTPTTLRVKREDRHKKGGSKTGATFEHAKDNYPTAAPMSNPAVSAPTKDDAYHQFLREMEELL